MIVREDWVHKNRGLQVDGVKMVRMTRVDLGTIHMKTKTKVGPVDHHIVDIPKHECVSRLVNWRKLLKSEGDSKTQPGPDSNPRKVAFLYDDDLLLVAMIWVSESDPQVWDSQPSDWTGQGWVPFFVAFRPKGETQEEETEDD